MHFSNGRFSNKETGFSGPYVVWSLLGAPREKKKRKPNVCTRKSSSRKQIYKKRFKKSQNFANILTNFWKMFFLNISENLQNVANFWGVQYTTSERGSYSYRAVDCSAQTLILAPAAPSECNLESYRQFCKISMKTLKLWLKIQWNSQVTMQFTHGTNTSSHLVPENIVISNTSIAGPLEVDLLNEDWTLPKRPTVHRVKSTRVHDSSILSEVATV